MDVEGRVCRLRLVARGLTRAVRRVGGARGMGRALCCSFLRLGIDKARWTEKSVGRRYRSIVSVSRVS